MKYFIIFLGFFLVTSVQTAHAQYDSIPYMEYDRTYLLHLPTSYHEDNSYAMIVAMHGGFGSAYNLEYTSQLSQKADSCDFIVVYPEGVPSIPFGIRTWNAGWCCGYAEENDIDDIGFINALLDTLLANYSIDEDRIFATGMSNGGMMSYRLACQLSHRIAAVAPVASTMVADFDCMPTRPVPIIHFHSFWDEHVPFEGGVGIGPSEHYNPPVDSVLNYWAEQNGCQALNDTVYHGDDYLYVKWHECDEESEIDLYVTYDGGHSWPGGNQGSPWGDPPSEVINANDLMWEFFLAHPMPDSSSTGILKSENISVPKSFHLYQNYPNPFNPTTTINFNLPVGTYNYTSLQIYDVSGKLVKNLMNDKMESGYHSVNWDGKDDRGEKVASGLYFYQIKSGKFSQTKQCLLLK